MYNNIGILNIKSEDKLVTDWNLKVLDIHFEERIYVVTVPLYKGKWYRTERIILGDSPIQFDFDR